VASYLSKELKSEIRVGGIDISLGLDVILEGFYATDQKKDTLLYAKKLSVRMGRFGYNKRIMHINKLILSDGLLDLKIYPGDSVTNIQFLADYFSSNDTTSSTSPKWDIRVHGVELNHFKFNYSDEAMKPWDTGMDYNHIALKDFNLNVNNIRFTGDSTFFDIEKMSVSEKCGFRIDKLIGEFLLSPVTIEAKNLSVKTDKALLDLDLKFAYSEFADFNDFVEKVKVKASIRKSELNFSELAYFATELEGFDEKITISGDVAGTVANFKAKDLRITNGAHTSFYGNVKMSGLPDIEETYIQLSIRECTTHPDDINMLHLPGNLRIELPEKVLLLGKTRISGTFTGFYDSFVSYATFKTALGDAFTDLSLKKDPVTAKIIYNGKVVTRNFDLGQLLDAGKYIGKININTEITGSGFTTNDLNISLKGIVDSVYLSGNDFRNITIDGNFKEKKFNGFLNIKDKNIDLDFAGAADFNTNRPQFNFTTNIKHANLNKLNLIHSDSTYILNTQLACNFEGIDIDSVIGSFRADSTLLLVNRSQYKMKLLQLEMTPQSDSKTISLNSDFLDFKLKGRYQLAKIPLLFARFLDRYLPSVISPGDTIGNMIAGQTIDMSLDLKNTRNLTKIFVPGVEIKPGTSIKMQFRGGDSYLDLHSFSPGIIINGIEINQCNVGLEGNINGLSMKTSIDNIHLTDSLRLDSIVISSLVMSDSIPISLSWFNESRGVKNSGNINACLQLDKYPVKRLLINTSKAYINDSLWSIPGGGDVVIDSTSIQVNKFSINGKREKILLNGMVSKDPLDHMVLEFSDFNVSNLDELTKSIDFNFDGIINGKVDFSNLYEAPNFIAGLIVKNFTVNGDKLGDAEIRSAWDPVLKALYAKAEVIYKGNIGESKPIAVEGYYYPEKADSSLNFNISLKKFKLKNIANLLSSFTSKFTGYADGQVRLVGSASKPSLTGTLIVTRGEMRIDYLNVSYSFNHEVKFGRNYIGFDNLIALDSLGNKAVINGKIRHDYFYHFNVDISIEPEKLLTLNTDYYQNNLFYGKAFATGKARISGPVDNLVMDISAQTDKGTQFYLPINLTMDVSANNFISFKKDNEEVAKADSLDYKVDLSGISMNFDLRATPDATVKIFMPGNMGNIRASGNGNIKMGINTRGEFNIYGAYEVEEGTFLFTLQNVIQRHFNLQKGGRIMFPGNPYETKVDIQGTYSIDVPLSGLKPQSNATSSSSDTYNRKIKVDCGVLISGSLFNPDISFKLNLPEKDPEVSRLVFSQIDTNNQQQMTEQMIFLLVLRQFKPIERGSSIDFGTSVGGSSWELLSNQLSSWLSQINNNFDLGVNYKPGDKLSRDEITMALSTQLFNDRVLIESNFGVAGNNPNSTSNQNASNIVGDVNVEAKITKDGRFRVKAFNKSNNTTLFENNAPFTQGVGVFFRKEFDTFGDLFRNRKKAVLQ
jgi:hypothetical protein